ncbi:cytidine deaminase [Anatilimnocola sp. NA78]|uniref:cytidine deaminase n=1 Tax=Anatilimnocola sp. NA78 TaxID=3415683 RepID=UPI003CE52EFA
MKLATKARRLAKLSRSSMLTAAQVSGLLSESGLAIESFLLELIPLAQELARPPISNFHVGAVALGSSGAVYLGANLEFPTLPLSQTVHAEQAAVINAANHGETGLLKLAVSAPPCGYCRQFLFELATAAELQIVLANSPSKPLTDYLPFAFGPRDLGITGGMLQTRPVLLEPKKRSRSELELRTLRAARSSYAPYTHAYAAVGLQTATGEIVVGPYLENAAFNPSISPAQAALVALALAGHAPESLTAALIAQPKNSAIDHARATKTLLQQAAPQVRLQTVATS